MKFSVKKMFAILLFVLFMPTLERSAHSDHMAQDLDDELIDDDVAIVPSVEPRPLPSNSPSGNSSIRMADIVCSYQRAAGTRGFQSCQAASRFHDTADSLRHPRFSVKCGYDVIYNNGSNRLASPTETRIQAHNSPFPTMILPLSGFPTNSQQQMASTLELNGQTMQGTCAVTVQ